MPDKLKVLFLGPRPRDVGKLITKKELRGVLFRVAQAGQQIDLIDKFGVEFTDLPGLLTLHEPDVLHLSAHGSKKGFLAFENEVGDFHAVPIESFKQVIRAHASQSKIGCVVVNSCQMDDLGNSLQDVVPYVIASPADLQSVAAVDFSEIFYQQLAMGRSVPIAFDMGTACSEARSGDGGKYQLYRRHSADRLEEPFKPRKPPDWPPLVFVNSVNADEKYLNELKKRLKPVIDRGVLSFFDKSMVPLGVDWRESLQQNLDKARLVLLFTSADALADEGWNLATKQAMSQLALNASSVVPIRVRPVSYAHAEFEFLPALPADGTTLSEGTLNARERRWEEIVSAVIAQLKQLK